MSKDQTAGFALHCPVPRDGHTTVQMAHGGGGELTRRLLEDHILPKLGNDLLAPLTDSALLPAFDGRICFTTDAYVVQPLAFPGGDIGSLAVSGTVNDLSVMGCQPLAISLGFVIAEGFPIEDLKKILKSVARTCLKAKVPVVIAAGNHYYTHESQQGMAYPAIMRECVSVGAVYDAPEGAFGYNSGAVAYSSRAGQITPFSQRLHPDTNSHTRTDIFAPGAPVTSSGILGEHGESTQHGTSQAAPVTAGLILLMQEFYQRVMDELPSVE